MMSVLTYDIGGTRVKAALVANGGASAPAIASTAGWDSAPAAMERLVSIGRELTAGRSVDAIGVSVRGLVDPGSGVLTEVNAPLTCLAGAPLGPALAAAFDAPASVENDGRMTALGELRHGAGRGEANIVCMTLGTGVGLGVALDGRVLRGPRGARGVLGGHFTVAIDGPRCGCGNDGCLQAFIGADALVDHARAQLDDGAESALDAETLDPAAILARAAIGDPVATRTRDRLATVLGHGIVTMIHAYDPDVFVLGGGLSRSAPVFLPQVREYVRAHAWTRPKGRVRLAVSELGDLAALLGAFELATDDTWAW